MGPSGRLLRDALERVGLDPEDAYITNVYKEYKYGNPTPTSQEIAAARSGLATELGALPNLAGVLLLGNVPLKAVTGLSAITHNRGVQASLPGFPAGGYFGTLHPAAVLRNPRYKSGWLNDLAAFAATVNGTKEDYQVRIVRTEADLRELVSASTEAELLGALDVETTIGDPFREEMEMICVGVSFDGHTAYILDPAAPVYSQALEILSPGKWIMHNGSFDLMVLRSLPVSRDYPWTLAQDTMAMAYLAKPDEQKGLQILSGVYLGLPAYKDVDYKNIKEEPFEKIATMNGRDVCRTLLLFRPLADLLNADPHLSRTYQWLLLPAISRLVDMTIAGVPLDVERLGGLREELEREVEELKERLREGTPEPDPETYGKEQWPRIKGEGHVFNPKSSQQVAHILFDQLGFPILKETDTGAPSTDKSVLTKLLEDSGDSWLVDLIAYRKSSKILDAFVSKWPDHMDSTNRMHPRYKPTQVVTGRLAAENPNIQQVPRKDARVKKVFGGVPGHQWVRADLSQIELRIAAWLAQEQTMLSAFRDGTDLHALTAGQILGDPTFRQGGKTLNFGLLYGAFPGKLVEVARNDYGVTMTKDEATRYRAAWFEMYPAFEAWHDSVKMELRATQMIASPLGRVRHFPEVAGQTDEWVVRAAEREAINHPVQSFASDLLLAGMTRMPDHIARYAIAEIHDELDFLVPDDEVEAAVPVIKAVMEDATWLQKWGIILPFPVVAEVEYGPHWSNE